MSGIINEWKWYTISWFINGILFCFLIFLHARCKSEFWSISEWRVRYLKGQIWLTLKAAMRIFDHGVRTRISVEQRAKALVFKKNRRSSPLEIAWEYQISKVNCSMNMSCMHACSERALQTIISPKGTEPNIWKLSPATGSHFPLFVYEIILCDIF